MAIQLLRLNMNCVHILCCILVLVLCPQAYFMETDNQGPNNQGAGNQGSDNQGINNQGPNNQGAGNQGSDNQETETPGNNVQIGPCPNDWLLYKDERCLKLFDTDHLKNYLDAKSLCQKTENSSLVTIDLLEKQKFIETLLKSKSITNNLWLGLENLGDGKHSWSDGTSLSYANWKAVPDKTKNLCNQFEGNTADAKTFGKWSGEACETENIVLCEKIQLWTPEKLQIKIMNTMNNIVPLDFIYVQLPKHKGPNDIWPWMVWEDVSNEYNNLFFRVIGNKSKQFGQVQEQGFPRLRLKDTSSLKTRRGKKQSLIDVHIGKWSKDIVFQAHGNDQHYLTFMHTEDDVIPRNMAIKIWQRKY